MSTPAPDVTAVSGAPPGSARDDRPFPLKILVWITSFSLLACGTTTFVLGCMNYIGLSEIFVSFYLMVFGVIACLCELRLSAIDNLFGILRADNGMGMFFVFVGTLGMSFGISKGANRLVPFISGIVWAASGAVLITGGAIFKCRGSHSSTVTGVENV